jgi:hypothetical protein
MQITFDTVSGELRLDDATGRALGAYPCESVMLAVYGKSAWRATSRRGSSRIALERLGACGEVLEFLLARV